MPPVLRARVEEAHQPIDFGGRRWPPVRAARQRRQHGPRARRFVRRPAAGLQEKISRRLGELPVPVTLNGPSIVTLSTSGIPTGVIGIDALAQEGLQQVDRRRGALFQERDAEKMRAGLHGQADLESRLERVACGGRIQVVGLLVVGAAEPREVDALAVEGHLEIVRDLEAADDVHRLAVQPRLDHVLAVDRERVADRGCRRACRWAGLRCDRPARGPTARGTSRPSASPSGCRRPGR